MPVPVPVPCALCLVTKGHLALKERQKKQGRTCQGLSREKLWLFKTALGPKKKPSPAKHFGQRAILKSRTFSQLNRKRASNGFSSIDALGPFPVRWWLV
jgi:hypothetical protein